MRKRKLTHHEMFETFVSNRCFKHDLCTLNCITQYMSTRNYYEFINSLFIDILPALKGAHPIGMSLIRQLGPSQDLYAVRPCYREFSPILDRSTGSANRLVSMTANRKLVCYTLSI